MTVTTTFWELVEAAGDARADDELLRDDHGRSLTAERLRAAAEAVAAGLHARGVAGGTVVSWQLPTTLEAAVLALALARLGAVQNPVITVHRRAEVAAITTQVRPSLYVTPTRWNGFAHGEMARELGVEVLELDLEGDVGPDLRLPSGDPSTLPPPPRAADACRWLYFTSGTTAAPKGARHTDASLVASSAGMVEHLGLARPDVYPIAWPLAHIGGATMLATSLRAGACLVLFDRWDPATTPARMAAHRPTVLGSAQPFFRAYLDADRARGGGTFPDLRACTAGGAPTPPEVNRELVETFGIRGVVQSWGLTEFPIASCARAADDPPEALATTVGRASPGAVVRVVAPDGRDAAAGVEGELRLRGAQCFLGYVDPSLDGDAFDEDGWFRTGDLGTVDADGFVRVTGRLKDVIIRNAENISALEVEDVLLRHPTVADVAVVGLPDERTGERVVAAVVAADGATPTLDDLVRHCHDSGLARHKVPAELHVVGALERNPMGKVLKQQLRDQLIAGTPRPTTAAS